MNDRNGAALRPMGASQSVESAWDPHKPAFYF
jgi:hypothetical protein